MCLCRTVGGNRVTISSFFERLVQLAGSKLTPAVYGFINYVQSAMAARVRETVENQRRATHDKKLAKKDGGKVCIGDSFCSFNPYPYG